MAFESTEFDRHLNPAVPVASPLSGDTVSEPGSLVEPLIVSGSLPSLDVSDRPVPRPINYATPQDDTVPKIGPSSDVFQLDTDPTGELTKRYGAATGQGLSNSDVVSLNVLGKRMSRGTLSQTEEGRKLLEIADRRRQGHRRNFFDAMDPTDWGPEKLPFLSLFATVGKSIKDAVTVSNTFEKMQKGEAVSDDELVKTALYVNENQERSDGTWGATVGDIVSQAPGFMVEFLVSGGMLGAARAAAAKKLSEMGSVKALSHVGLRRAEKILADETAEQTVKAGVSQFAGQILKDTSKAGLTKAAADFGANSALRKDTVATVAAVVENAMKGEQALAVTGADKWAPGVLKKVAEQRAEQAVAAAIARQSTSSAVRRAVQASGKVLGDGISRGILDAGNWGTEASTVLFTERSSAGRALVDALNTFIVEAPLRGGELMLANKAVTAPLSAALGGTVGGQELAIRQAAYMNNDEELMNKAHAIGLGLDLLEYVSENTGRGLKSLMRAGALSVNPKLAKATAKAAGQMNITGAKLQLEPSEAGFVAKGVEYSGLLEPGSGAEVGGIINRYISKVLGKPEDMRTATRAKKFEAVKSVLEKDGIRIANPAALEGTIAEGVVQPGLDPMIAERIGTDVNGFVKNALDASFRDAEGKLKIRAFAQYWAADFMARHQIGPQTAIDLFDKMGYDGIAGEMFEERYNDVVAGLFGLDAEKDHSLQGRVKHALEGMFPGWDQLTAEAVGFAFPMVARTATIRALNAIGGEQAYAEHRENSAKYLDAIRFGTVGQWRLGDLVTGNGRAIAAEESKRKAAEDKKSKLMAERPADADDQWEFRNIRPLDDEIETANRAIERLGDVHENFMNSLSEDVRADMNAVVDFAPMSVEEAEMPDEAYNRKIHATDAQARQSASAAHSLVKAAGKMGQTLYKMQSREEGDDIGAFRKASHWLVKAAGAMVTGDPGLMSMNPARWHGADVGLPETVQDALRDAYGSIFAEELSLRQKAKAENATNEDGPLHEVNVDEAHAAALAKFQPIAEQIMAADLAAHQTMMFSDSELVDLAMNDYARRRDLAPDTKTREYVSPTGERISFEDFYAKNRKFIDVGRKHLAEQAYDLFSSGALQQGRIHFSRGTDGVTVADVIDIPKDLPTRHQALLATVLKGIPGMRNVLRARQINPDMALDDQLGGMATRQAWLDKVADTVLPGGIVTADARDAALANADKVDPVIVEAIAKDLGFSYDGTEESLKDRNRKIVELAVLSRTLSDPNVRTYTQDGAVAPDASVSSIWQNFTTARRMSDGRWTYTKADGKSAVAATVEELDARMAEMSWHKTEPKVVFTTAQILQSDDAGTMIGALGLKKVYRDAMRDAAGSESRYMDPLFREGSEGFNNPAKADRIREQERRDAQRFIDHNNQTRPELYLEKGESRDNQKDMDKAKKRLDSAMFAYYSRYDKDRGYMTVADRLLEQRGCTVPYGNTGISVGAISSDLRGKYTISINAFRSHRQSNNIFVPINHETAQNYKTALLNATLVDAYFKNRRVVNDVFDFGIRSFMEAIDRIADEEYQTLTSAKNAKENEELAENIKAFRAATTYHEKGQVRKPSAQAFALLASAFALYQTEHEGNLKGFLGQYAPACSHLAKRVRADQSFLRFTAALDRIFGGAGFNPAAIRVQGSADATRGIARLYALFAPEGKPTLSKAIEDAAPGGLTAKEFVKRVNEMDVDAWKSTKPRPPAQKSDAPKGGATANVTAMKSVQDRIDQDNLDERAADAIINEVAKPRKRKSTPVDELDLDAMEERARKWHEARGSAPAKPTDVPKPAPVDKKPKTTPVAKKAPKTRRQRHEEAAVDITERLNRFKRVQEQRKLSADDKGGESVVEQVLAEEHYQGLKSTQELIRDAVADDKRDADAIEARRESEDNVTDDGESDIEGVDYEVTEDLFVGDMGSYSVNDTQTTVNADGKPNEPVIRDRSELTQNEIKSVAVVVGSAAQVIDDKEPTADRVRELVEWLVPGIREKDLGQILKTFSQMDENARKKQMENIWTWAADDVEEGALPDGYENGNAKSVAALRDNKALNNFLAFAQLVNPHTGRGFQAFVEDMRSTVSRSITKSTRPTVTAALKFVDMLINPRADVSATATIRDAKFNEVLDFFTADDRHQDEVARYINTLLGDGDPVNRKAAWTLMYLAAMPKNVRMQMTQLIASSAPADPVHLRTYKTLDGGVHFVIAPRSGNTSRLSTSAVSAMYTRFAGKSGADVAEAAARLRMRAEDMTKSGMFDHQSAVDLFDSMADLLEEQFGRDCPLVSVFSSRTTAAHCDERFGDRLVSNMSAKTGIPYMVDSIAGGLEYLAEITGDGIVSPKDAEMTAVFVVTSGNPTTGGLGWETNTSKKTDQLATVFRAYEEVMPHTIMTAEIDPARTRQAASSIAITMRGVEPAVQVFMDRTDDYGFRAVCERYFPEFKALSETEKLAKLGYCRQHMCWPDAGSTRIVAKSLSKSAYARETYRGCETSFDLGSKLASIVDLAEVDEEASAKASAELRRSFGDQAEAVLGQYRDTNTFYVPVYSGDHSSSVLIGVPLAKDFRGMGYEKAATEVSKWVGLDLLGVDAKRSATTSLEAPGVGFIGFKRDPKTGKKILKRDFNIGDTSYRGREVIWTDELKSSDGKRDISGQYRRGEDKIYMSRKNLESTFARKAWRKPANSKPLSDSLFTTIDDLAQFVILHETAHAELGTRPATVTPSQWEDRMNAWAIEQLAKREAETGECRINIVWTSEAGKNEAGLGTTLATGYGVERLKKCAKNPASSTLKFHAMNTAATGKYGASLTFLKSLDIALDNDKDAARTSAGDFLDCDSKKVLFDFIRKQRSSDAGWSTSILTDFDSMKLGLANSKMMGVENAKGEIGSLMEYVFQVIGDAIKNGADLESSYSGAALDDLIGEFKWVDNSKNPSKVIEAAHVSDILDNIRLDRIDGLEGHAFSLSFTDNDIMGFQVANVSHEARTSKDYGKTPRNYMIDAFTMAEVLGRGWEADASLSPDSDIFPDEWQVLEDLQDLVAGWGTLASDIASRRETVRSILDEDEDANEARLRGEPENGRFMRDIRARALATYLKKNLNIPINGIDAPLVSNMSWIDKDNNVRCHSKSQMFKDTLRGSRTIKASERRFFRGHRRMAICNVNNNDASFRYGMYLDEAKFKQIFGRASQFYYGKYRDQDGVTKKAGNEDQQIVAAIGDIITRIRDLELGDTFNDIDNDAKTLRAALLSCFMDHHGNHLDERVRKVKETRRNRKTGETTVTEREERFSDMVSFADLFTNLVKIGDRAAFDRTAVYCGDQRMTLDADGKGHIYLGGTMMGLPRTPSYNGSMWLQTVRAGLPVTERGEETDWRPGTDAMVAPDPFSLAILGCDHDGDKTKLYMLNAPSRSAETRTKLDKDLLEGDHFLSMDRFRQNDYEYLLERRATRNEKNQKTLDLHEWRVTDLGRTQANNTFVQSLFDMSRMLPVMDRSESEVPFYTGDKIDDTENHGAPAVGTKASLVYKKLWESEIVKNSSVITGKLLDPSDPKKNVGNPYTAALIGDGAQNAADARAIAVSLASSLHLAWASGLFNDTLFRSKKFDAESSRCWLDFIHHIDGLSNMTFDDIKEQVCSRLGITAGMMDSVIVGLINHTVMSGKGLPRTDKDFVEAFADYAKKANGRSGNTWLYYMNRATNKGDFEFQAHIRELFGVNGEVDQESIANRLGLVRDTMTNMWKPGVNAHPFIRHIMKYNGALTRIDRDGAFTACENLVNAIANEGVRENNDLIAAVAFALDSDAGTAARTAQDLVEWYYTRSELKLAKSFARSFNYLVADPVAPSADTMDETMETAWKRVMSTRTKGADADKLDRLAKMRSAVLLMYRLSGSRTFDGYAISAVDRFGDTFNNLAVEASNRNVRTGDREGAGFVVALASAERVKRSDRMTLEANAQMTGLAIAAFRTVRQLPGSKISSANALKVMRAFADGSAATFKGADNPGLSMCRGIEHVFELMYRLANSSTARRDLPIFSYFSERPETAFGFNFDTYFARRSSGDFVPDFLSQKASAKRDAQELGRITMAFQGITEGQMSDLRDLWARVVDGRELDPDGALGNRMDVYSERESKFGFSISEENLKALENELGLFDKDTATDSQKLKMKKAKKRYGRELETFRFLIAESRNVLAELKKLGIDSITPSVMFGQILPLYASLTSRLDRVPDSRTPSIVTVMPGVYQAWTDELARLDGEDTTADVLRALVPVNWAARNYSREYEDADPMSKKGKRLSQDEFAKKVADTKIDLTNYFKLRREFRTSGLVLENPNGRYFIDPFGNNGLFGYALDFLRTPGFSMRPESDRDDSVPDTVIANAVDTAVPGTTGEKADPFTKELSERMSNLIGKFNGGRVEYLGGKSFGIRVKLSGTAAAKHGTSEAVIRVDVVPRVEPVDESNVKSYVEAENWRASVKASQGWTDEELDKRIAKCKTPKALVRFAERFRPVGKSSDTEWTVDARGMKVLAGRISLEEQSKYKGTLYHEYFHQMMSMVRQLGVLSDEDLKILRDTYGADARRDGWFNEETAANAFEKFVSKGEGRNGVFAKILKFIEGFIDMFRDTGIRSEAFANDMSESPLAFMALTGQMDTSVVNDVIIEPEVSSVVDEAVNGTLVQDDLFYVPIRTKLPLDARPDFADISRHIVNSMKARVRSVERDIEKYGLERVRGYDEDVYNPFYKCVVDTDQYNEVAVDPSLAGDMRVIDVYNERIRKAGLSFGIGQSISRIPRDVFAELPSQVQYAVSELSFEGLMISVEGDALPHDEFVDSVYNLSDALDRLEELSQVSRKYEDALVAQGVEPEKAKKAASSGFRKVLNELRKVPGMDFVLNPTHAIVNGGQAFTVSDGDYMHPFDVEDMGEGTDALDVIFPDRAAGNYSQMNTFARAVGLAIRNGMSLNGLDAEAAGVLRTFDARNTKDCFRAGERAAAEEAVRQVASMYGIELGKKNTATRNRVFRALCEVNSMASSYKTRTNGPVDGSLGRFLSPTDLASAIAVSCGTTPVHMALSVKRDIEKLRAGYAGSSFEKVLDKCDAAMDELMKFDASRLNDSGYGEDLIGRRIHEIEAGLLGGGMNYETGVRDRYYLGQLDSSENPTTNANIADYGSHVDENGDGNEDFQFIMRRTLDTMYGALAGMKYMRELDFEPGDGGELPPADVPHKSPDETAAMLGIEARQLLDKDYDAVDFFDQPSFIANNMDAYLESTIRRTFGHEDVGKLQMDVVNRLSGFNRRFVNANNWLNALLGQNVLPGQKLFEASLVDGQFTMENGQVVAKANGRHVKFEMYRGKRTKIALTEDEHRLVDYVLKADKAWYQGARNVVTGVDNIRFTPDDLMARSEDYYSRENVAKRRASGKEISRIDETLYRIDFQIPAPFAEDIRARLVKSVVAGLEKARGESFAKDTQSLTDFMLYHLEGDGLIIAHQADVAGPGNKLKINRVLDQGVLVIPVEDIENAFQNSTAIEKLIDARIGLADSREEVKKLFSRENRIAPLHKLYSEFRQIVREFPWLTDGDGAFFNNTGTPLAFVRGTGVFMYNANRKAREVPRTDMGKLSAREETFLGMMRGLDANGERTIDAVTPNQLRLLIDAFGTQEKDSEALRKAIKDGRYAAGTPKARETGLVIGPNSDMRDVALAIYNRFVEAAWRENGDPVVERCGGRAAISRIISLYELHREDDTMPSGGVGLSDEQCYRCNAMLAANHQLGHAISNQILGIANAVTFRNTLVNMLMTPDDKGRPVMYADPSALAAQQGGVPDAVWGQIARWWASANSAFGVKYDESKTGVENARNVYAKIHDVFAKHGGIPTGGKTEDGKLELVKYGELKADELDAKSIVGVLAQSDDREAKLNTLGGGYAMGYAKQLMQASRHLGSAAQRAVIHRALSWSKSLSVSFSFFFPLATKFESPIGAVGAVAMLGSNLDPELVRKNPEFFNTIQKMFSGDGWLTQDFLGFRDVIAMMDSDDPFLSELIGWASALGVQLSDSNNNPIEPQRSVLQRDLANMREMVRDRMGAKAAKHFDNITRTLLLRSGDKAFTYALNATKLATVAQICMKLRHEAEKQGRAFDPIRDLKRYSGYINAEIGGIDPLKYAWAHPMNRSLMSMLMFSWEWTRGAWEAGGGGVIEDFLFGGHNVTAEERKYFLGRWARMFGSVMIGVPLLFQILIKAIAVAMGHDDDDEKWFTWQNEDKACWSAFDLTPLMKAMSERFPHVAQWKKDHPVLGGLLPMYTGDDRANRKFGSLDPETGVTNGRHYYMHFGKQGWEVMRWFTDPQGQFFSKLSMPTQRMLEGLFGRSLSWLDHELPWNDMGFAERWLNPSLDSATANMVKAFLPFTLSGAMDRGDAGLLTAFGPVQMGVAGTAIQDKMVPVLRDWAFNDRNGYKPVYRLNGKFHSTVTGLNSSINHLVHEAMVNGAPASDALKIVDSALGKLTASLYGELMDALPSTPDGDFDAKKVARIARAINRLGRKHSDLCESINNKLKSRKAKLDPALRQKWREVLREAFRDPYGYGVK